MSGSSLTATLVGALEGSISVLLTAFAGYLTSYYGLLDRPTVKKISNVSSLLFLPCLIVVQMGPQLTVKEISKLWIMPVWGAFSSLIAHLVGWAGMAALNLPAWTIVASGRANANALPLLLLHSLENTGVLDSLKKEGESVSTTLDRAKSIVLLNSIIQQMVTFGLGPMVFRIDKARAKKDGGDDDPEGLRPGRQPHGYPTVQDREHVGLLHDYDGDDQDADDYTGPLHRLEDVPNMELYSRLPPRMRKAVDAVSKPLNKVLAVFNPPLIGGIVALIIGITPPLHEAFLSKDGIFYNTLTEAVSNLGQLFVTLQMFVLGAQLATVKSANPGVKSTLWVLLIRYGFMPAVSLAFVYFTAGRSWYTNDPLVWFLLILVPSGPSAMLLMNLAELMNIDQGPVAGMLTISYLVSPLIAVVCSLGLQVVSIAQERS
ncbi:hypothetical protein GLOTRDRAFT_44443 [Gloeophyllum trabeum ATCC 11539]|uniref:Auxin efflux carrier n=1 Tax=Gloeophyllum trabeum (strain ATCC 11539 / FP-39264 / Madison 617) TaxID=670483 RepID=S7RIP1_GLOTA|nr:uncharacterized protein GLOTRDRAFT_44443 [Gloeophyllum trabeum ATCC 11539]EPQ54205.1 hypothetical protein GLOTRDRAFT_44443 [Gloeophyllum trabeum ATCC 11539]